MSQGRVIQGISSRANLGVWFGGNSFMLAFETEYEWGSLAMSHDFEHKYVGLVATIIGGAVLLLGIGGILYNLS